MQKVYKDCDLTDQLLERRNETTPDWLDIKLLDNIPVFVYGTLMTGESRSGFLKDSIFLGEAYTATQGYVMEKAPQGFPVVFSVGVENPKSARIYGEVYLVKPGVILNLDMIEANGFLYQRRKKFVYLLEQEIKPGIKLKPSLKCWLYHGLSEAWEDQPSYPMKTSKVNDKEAYMWSSSFEDEIPNFLRQ